MRPSLCREVLLFGDDREFGYAWQVMSAGDVAECYEPDLSSFRRRAVYDLLNRIGLDVGKLTFCHFLPIDKELIMGDMAGRIAALVGCVAEALDGLRFVQLDNQFWLVLGQGERRVAIAVEDNRVVPLSRSTNLVAGGGDV